MRHAKCDCFRWHRLRKTKEPDDETTANHTGMFNFANMSMSDSRAKQCSQLGVPARFVEARCYAATNKPIQVYLHHTPLLRQYVRQHEGESGSMFECAGHVQHAERVQRRFGAGNSPNIRLGNRAFVQMIRHNMFTLCVFVSRKHF